MNLHSESHPFFPGEKRASAGWIGSKLVPPTSPSNNISSKESGLWQDRPQRFRAYALDIFYELKPSVDVILPEEQTSKHPLHS
jgi:hypothetical protein